MNVDTPTRRDGDSRNDVPRRRERVVLPGVVEQIAMPRSVRRLTTLARVDYTDAFVGAATSAGRRTGEQWARTILEAAPSATRAALKHGWLALGLRFGSLGDEHLVLGWNVRRSDPDFAVIGSDSPLGLRGEVLFRRTARRVLMATFVQLDNPVARLVWASIAPIHRRAVRHVLEEGIRRADQAWVIG
jgi:hypothetical protein